MATISRLPALVGPFLVATTLTAQAQYSTPMRDVENPARSPWILQGSASLPTPFLNGIVNFATPPGKRYVINFIAVSCSTSSASDVFTQVNANTIKLISATQAVGFNYPAVVKLERSAGVFSGFLWQGSAQVTLYTDANPNDSSGGNGLQLNIFHTDTSVAASCSASITGHTLTL